MNILPHKSWHVWNRANREKVARDEKEHDEKEDRKKKRQLEIEQEKRVTLLREKRQRLSTHEPTLVQQPEEEQGSAAAAPLRHINFFEEEERAQAEAKEHPERVAEAKAAKEKELKQFTTFLGQSAAEKQDTKPWWYQPPPKEEDEEGGREGAREATKPKTDKQRKSDRWKERADPLVSVKKHVREKKEKEEKRRKEEEAANALFKRQQRLRLEGTSSSSSPNKHKKQLIWSRKKEDREGRGPALSVETNAKATKQMSEKGLRLQQMREERLQREQKEQLKTRALLQSNSGGGGHPQNHAAGYNPQYLTYSRGRTRADSALVRRERGGARLRDDY